MASGKKQRSTRRRMKCSKIGGKNGDLEISISILAIRGYGGICGKGLHDGNFLFS